MVATKWFSCRSSSPTIHIPTDDNTLGAASDNVIDNDTGLFIITTEQMAKATTKKRSVANLT